MQQTEEGLRTQASSILQAAVFLPIVRRRLHLQASCMIRQEDQGRGKDKEQDSFVPDVFSMGREAPGTSHSYKKVWEIRFRSCFLTGHSNILNKMRILQE